MKITNEEWCWDYTYYNILSEYPIAIDKDHSAVLVMQYNRVVIKYINKYGFSRRFSMYCRTHAELDNVKHYLLNEGFKMNWKNYQAILEMFNERFKTHSPYLG